MTNRINRTGTVVRSCFMFVIYHHQQSRIISHLKTEKEKKQHPLFFYSHTSSAHAGTIHLTILWGDFEPSTTLLLPVVIFSSIVSLIKNLSSKMSTKTSSDMHVNRSSTRRHAPPGGNTSISFGWESKAAPAEVVIEEIVEGRHILQYALFMLLIFYRPRNRRTSRYGCRGG